MQEQYAHVAYSYIILYYDGGGCTYTYVLRF